MQEKPPLLFDLQGEGLVFTVDPLNVIVMVFVFLNLLPFTVTLVPLVPEYGFKVIAEVPAFTETDALPIILRLVAFIFAVPVADATNMADAFPSEPVIANNEVTFPTFELLIVQDMLTPDIGLLF